jgi:hypothetical protein
VTQQLYHSNRCVFSDWLYPRKREFHKFCTLQVARKPRVFATTVLRRANKQWRILSHHAVWVHAAPHTDTVLDVPFTPHDAARRKFALRQLENSGQARKVAELSGMSALQRRFLCNLAHVLTFVNTEVSAVESVVRQRLARLLHEAGKTAPSNEIVRIPELRRRPDGGFERAHSPQLNKPLQSGDTESASPSDGTTGITRDGTSSATTETAATVSPGGLDIDRGAPLGQQTIQAIRILTRLGR